MTPSPLVQRKLLAAELRALRGTRFTGDKVAGDLGWSPSKVSRYELARTGLRSADVARLLDYYEVTGDKREYLLSLAEDGAVDSWWDSFTTDLSVSELQMIGFQESASEIRQWSPGSIPVLLRTYPYAREIITARSRLQVIPPARVKRLTDAMMAQQMFLTRGEGTTLDVTVPEHALTAPAGTREMVQDQLRSLIVWSQRPGITIRVIPDGSYHPVYESGFSLMRFLDTDEEPVYPDVAAVQYLSGVTIEDGEEQTFLYTLAYQQLTQAAADPDMSREIITACLAAI